MKIPTIALVDDHLIFRSSLKLLIDSEQIGKVIYEASNGKEFLEILDKIMPDLVIMDIDMPVMDGVEATEKALSKFPSLKILVLSMFGDENYYYKMVNAGVKGFLMKTADINEFMVAIKEICNDESYFSNELLRKVFVGFQQQQELFQQFSDRELEVLKLICNGLTNEEIGEKLNISSKTVKGHRANLLAKTGCKNTPSMVIFAIKNKLIKISR